MVVASVIATTGLTEIVNFPLMATFSDFEASTWTRKVSFLLNGLAMFRAKIHKNQFIVRLVKRLLRQVTSATVNVKGQTLTSVMRR